MKLNSLLKLVFICTAFAFLFVLVTTPKTPCEACSLPSENGNINGNAAFTIFEKACISYAKPWNNDELIVDFNYTEKEYIYVDIDDINVTTSEDGITVINFTP